MIGYPPNHITIELGRVAWVRKVLAGAGNRLVRKALTFPSSGHAAANRQYSHSRKRASLSVQGMVVSVFSQHRVRRVDGLREPAWSLLAASVALKTAIRSQGASRNGNGLQTLIKDDAAITSGNFKDPCLICKWARLGRRGYIDLRTGVFVERLKAQALAMGLYLL
jgi:hypothetical protein